MAYYAGNGYIGEEQELDDTYIRHDVMAAAGELITHDNITGLSQAIAAGTDGQLLVARPAIGTGARFETISVTLPWVAKGDLVTYNGATQQILPVGTNAYVLTADSTAPNGIAWKIIPPDNDLESVNFRSWGAGSSRPAVGSYTDAVYIGDNVQAGNTSVVLGSKAKSGVSSVTAGYSAGTAAAASCVILGNQAGTAILGAGTGNTIAGYQAGTVLTTGASNVILGASAGVNLSTGANNVILGPSSGTNAAGTAGSVVAGASGRAGTNSVSIGNSAESGDSSVCLGYQAASVNTNLCQVIGYQTGALIAAGGTGNAIIGYQSAQALTTGTNNVIIGPAAGNTMATGGSNTLVGNSTNVLAAGTAGATAIGSSASAGDNSVALGIAAVSSGPSQVVIGNLAETGATSGNICIGNQAGSTYLSAASTATVLFLGDRAGQGSGASSAGVINMGVGSSALNSITTNSTQNTAVGHFALQSLVGGSDRNTALGHQAGLNLTTSSDDNTLIGNYCGNTMTSTAIQNTLVGSSANVLASGVDTATGVGYSVIVATNACAFGNLANASATNSSAFGANSSCSGTGSQVIGYNSSCTVANAQTLGIGLANSTTNTSYIGVFDATSKHTVRSNGYFKNTKACAAGIARQTGSQVIAAGPTTVTMPDVLWDDSPTGDMADTVNSRMYLGGASGGTVENGQIFNISIHLRGTVSSSNTNYYITLLWFNGAGLQTLVENVVVINNGDTVWGTSLPATQKVPAAAAAVNYVYVVAERVSGSGSLTINYASIKATRVA